MKLRTQPVNVLILGTAYKCKASQTEEIFREIVKTF